MKQLKKIFCITLVAGLLCFVLISGTTMSAEHQGPCFKDGAKFCANIKPGTTAFIDCLEKHEAELSDACRDYEAKATGRIVVTRDKVKDIKKFRETCAIDIGKFCKAGNPEQGGILRCLNDHESELSASCIESMEALKE